MLVLERLARRADLPARGAAVHLLGAGGAGMQGLALLLAAEGYRLSGSDRDDAAARPLERVGVRLYPEEDLRPVRDADLVVYSAALAEDHPCLVAAREASVPAMKRARATAALCNEQRLVAVAGTHGKTTVTAMVALVLEKAGLDPTAVVGGRVVEWGANARAGAGETVVVEADEYDRSLLELDPSLGLLTSVEPEHLECYGSLAALEEAFVEFAARAAEDKGVLTCADAPGAKRVREALGTGRSYGLSPDADYSVEVVAREAYGQRCALRIPGGRFFFELGVPGDHNAQNAAGALAAALMLGVEADALRRALHSFRGVARRMERLFEHGGRVVLDDYAHHPTEVRATIAALRHAYPGRDVTVVFQPHLFSRTQALAAELAEALTAADRALVLPIYAAREEPLPGVTARLVVQASSGAVRETTAEAVLEWLRGERGEGIVVFMGAGDVTDLAHRAAMELEARALGR